MGMTGAGAATGLVIGWFATQGMAPDTSSGPAPPVQLQPTVTPVPGGAALGVVGAM
jgi:hypothetical protein